MSRVFSLSKKAELERANITHIVSVLAHDAKVDTYQRHSIKVDDVDYENILEHFPAAIKFIQSGLDSGGSVLVHWYVTLLSICIFAEVHRSPSHLLLLPNL